MFCHVCGALQPPRGDDCFARLGLSPRFEVELAALDRQYAGFCARLAAERFAGRSAMEKSHAALHREALDRARAVLADPWRRALHLLGLRGRRSEADSKLDLSPEASGARARMLAATDPAELEPLIGDVSEKLELCYVELEVAFRRDDLDLAQRLVAEVGRLRRMLADARRRRAELGSR
jgi:molecular chaperone HscB